ncbi:DUF3048 domain-containing protein [Amphibacillus sp. Q70]|uniref:DUF3048 domain-containing protein n=1 Tax=Amphibacillus sp. Q70 TaxID=3453416 RepID=UPI003F87CF50
MKYKSLIGLVLFILMVAGCSNNFEKNSQDLEKKEFEQEELDTIEPEFTFPLTGIRTAEPSTNRIVSVMVNNHPAARPQSGLSQADIVFEILAEGQTTRFLAMFQSEKPEVVGPVRSARPYYFNLANAYNALYVYHGAADHIEDMLRGGAADHLNGSYFDNDGHLFNRDSSRVAPHNSYLNFTAVEEVARNQGYEMEVEHKPLSFLEQDQLDDLTGESVSEVSLSYGQETVRYQYDQTADAYLRYNGDQQTVDLNDQAPIQLNNVFIMETAHQVIDEQGRREIDFTSGGNAYLLQKGLIQKIQWQNIDGHIVPVQDGDPVDLVPGKTWINVIPTSPGLAGVDEIE